MRFPRLASLLTDILKRCKPRDAPEFTSGTLGVGKDARSARRVSVGVWTHLAVEGVDSQHSAALYVGAANSIRLAYISHVLITLSGNPTSGGDSSGSMRHSRTLVNRYRSS